ncbi:hypothetical protein AB7360_15135 [Providencia alcalifaciens]|uniref:hypothetical protein n=1 Tax=Providencia TaxID=586 RepID=UPI001E117CFA|nr:hypothetical protein [Providencia rettgeri]EHZ7763619.1 hypothetical protein [Providencia rettgeri]EIJ7166761.1 hypothetical protein [Providencia rettgeri]EJD6047141.1 hypothetical protein [Providencia rettgeri]ELH9582966.1 hypothetical protein [Providencia rettgeri]ELM3936578.1 hypothetical protein [Providencia rettgeri]
MNRLVFLIMLLPFIAIASDKESGKDFFIKMVEGACSDHKDPKFCKWQMENLSAMSSINTLTYYRCKLNSEKGKECDDSVEMFDYIQDQYDKNMAEIKSE